MKSILPILLLFVLPGNLFCQNDSLPLHRLIEPALGQKQLLIDLNKVDFDIPDYDSIPELCRNVRIYIQLQIDSTGAVTSIEQIKPEVTCLDLTPLKTMLINHDWIPARKNGRNVSSYYKIPLQLTFY